MCNVPCLMCSDFNGCDITKKSENLHDRNISAIMQLKDFADRMFSYLKENNLLNDYSKYCLDKFGLVYPNVAELKHYKEFS